MARGPYRGQYGSSQSSRSSRVHMPPIAEDEPRDQSDSAALAVATTMAAGRPPRTPLRVPPKISQAAPPPYVPVTHISPPRYNDDDGSVAASSESFEGRRSSDAARFEKQQQVQHHDHQFVEGGSRLKRWADRQWFGSRRKRWAVFVSLGLLAVSIAVGLAVGLTFGLRDGRSADRKPEEQDNDDDAQSAEAVFPAGSYSFATTLQKTSTSCTSHSTTWRCYPYEDSSNATFFWIITSDTSRDADSPFYTVSSTETPFAPSFANLTATLSGRGTSDERLTFFFDMDKTVIPSDSLTPSNRAAECTFKGTRFETTLWTRRRDGREIDPDREASSNFAAWPADVEVIQTKDSEEGEPRCEDRDGNKITDVQAGDGECVCGYASFELE